MRCIRLSLPTTALLLWVAAAPAASPAVNGAEGFEPRPFVAHYQVRYGVLSGELTLQLEHHRGEDWIMTSVATTRGVARVFRRGNLVERTMLRFTENGVEPLEYNREDGISGPDRNASLMFVHEEGRVVGMDREDEVDLPLNGDLHDRLSIQLQLMHDLSDGLRREQYQVIDRAEMRRMTVKYADTETITVDDRQFDTLALDHQSENSSRTTRLWCALEYGFLPVRIQQTRRGSVEWTGTLQSIEWGDPIGE